MVMRKYIPIAAALAVVVLFGVAIMASGEVLSFSVPGAGDSVVERVPADQSQPQDFGEASTEGYYFGPDFMCLIYGNTNSIECFGSDADGIVSNAPVGTGFTRIDGGDSYACAFRSTDRFTYCWGSISRQPSVAQPTATPEPTATPAATSTSLPPGVTPEPTATSEPAATSTATPEPLTRTACHIPRSGSETYPLTLTGTWVDACTYSDGHPYIWDDWRQQGTGSVTITARSADDPYLALYEIDDSIPVGDEGWVTFLAENDDIDTAAGNYDAQIVHTLEDGKHYWVSVEPYSASARGSFTLTYTSTDSGLGWAASYDPNGDLPDQSQMQAMMERSRE